MHSTWLCKSIGATASFSMQVAFVDAEWYLEATFESGTPYELWARVCHVPLMAQ